MFIYPNNAIQPSWVNESLYNFDILLKDINTGTKPKELIIEFIEKALSIKITKPLTKSEIGKLVQKLGAASSNEDFQWKYYLLLNFGFKLSSLYPSSIDNRTFNVPKEFLTKRNNFVKDFNDGKITIVQLDKAFTNLTKEIIEHFSKTNVTISDIVNSGAAGTVDSIRQMIVGLGITISAKKEVIDVIGSGLSEGQTQTEYFNQASHAIQALYAKSADTAIPGYAGRKLSTIMEHIKLSKQGDCGSQKGLRIKIKDAKLLDAIIGKNIIVPKTLLNKNGFKEITGDENLIGKTIELRSPLFCVAKDGICKTCFNTEYVNRLELGPGANIGLMSSTMITELLTTLTLKKSHTGILLGKQKVNLIEDIEEIYE